MDEAIQAIQDKLQDTQPHHLPLPPTKIWPLTGSVAQQQPVPPELGPHNTKQPPPPPT